MPEYIASGSHYFYDRRYRFIILHRLECDLSTIIKSYKLAPKNILIIAGQIIDVLKHLHSKGYAHSDIKSENLMIGDVNIANKRLNSILSENSKDVSSMIEDKNGKSLRKNRTSVLSFSHIEYSGSNPLRSCRLARNRQQKTKHFSIYQDMVKSHYLRPTKNIKYYEDDGEDTPVSDNNEDVEYDEEDDDEEDARSEYTKTSISSGSSSTVIKSDEHIYLIDFGLASKFIDSNGLHHQFCQDQRRAHDGTLEFTSRDAHMGAHSRRSDLECLGFNLIYWSQGFLPWKDNNNENKYISQPEQVQRMKEYFMLDCKKILKLIYGDSCPKFLGEFLSYVNKLAYDECPDYEYCKSIFRRELMKLGFTEPDSLSLNLNELKMNKIKNDCVKPNLADMSLNMKKFKSIWKWDLLLPFQDTGTVLTAAATPVSSNQVSPKNLRSKMKQNTRSTIKKKQLRTKIVRKTICTSLSCCSSGSGTSSKSDDTLEQYIDIFNRDPDQIARKRAEKEYERGEQNLQLYGSAVKYSGHPTYAILAIENKLKLQKEKEALDSSNLDNTLNNIVYEDSLGKPAAENLSKKQIHFDEYSIDEEVEYNKQPKGNHKHTLATTTAATATPTNGLTQQRRRLNLRPIRKGRTNIKRNSNHHQSDSIIEESDDSDDNSDSTAASNSTFDNNQNNSCKKQNSSVKMNKKVKKNQERSRSLSSNKTTSYSEDSSNLSSASSLYTNELNTGDDDSRDTIDFSPIKTRRARSLKVKKNRNLYNNLKKQQINGE